MTGEPTGSQEHLVEVLRDYADHLRAAGNRPGTVRARTTGVNLIAQAAGRDPRWATTSDLVHWLADETLAPWSRTTYYSHARAWFAFLVETGRRGEDPSRALRRPKTPRGVPRPITNSELADLLATATGHTHSYVLLAALAGLRVHEVAKIRGEDVTERLIRVVGKGGNDATVPTHPLIWADAEHYPRKGWWFPSHGRQGHIRAESVSAGIRRAMLAAGIDAHAHSLRHFFGTNALKAAGGDIRVAQTLLRHASPATTALYTLVDSDDARAAVDRLYVA